MYDHGGPIHLQREFFLTNGGGTGYSKSKESDEMCCVAGPFLGRLRLPAFEIPPAQGF